MQTFSSETLNLARRYWGMELVRGIAAIIFGLLAIFWPHFTFGLFIVAFGIFAIVEGVILCINGFAQSAGNRGQGNETYRSTLVGDTQHSARGSERSGYRATTPNEGGTLRSTGGGYRPGAGIYQRVTGRSNWGSLLMEGLLSIAVGILCLVLPSFVGRLALYAVATWAVFKGIGFLMQTPKRGWIMGVIGVLAIILALIMFFNPLSLVRTILWIVGVFSLIMGVLLVLRGIQHNATAGREHGAERERPLEPTY